MNAQSKLRRLCRLDQYSDRIEARLTARHELSLRLIGSRPGEKVLDIGASYGWLEQIGPFRTNAEYVGIEYDEHNLRQAHKNIANATIVEGSVLNIPFASQSFDGVVLFEVLEHIPAGSESTAFKEIGRVLKPNGWFLLSTPFNDIRSRLLDPAAYLGHRHYSSERVEALLQRAGFSVKQSIVRGGWWESITMILLYFFKHVMGAEVAKKEFFEQRRNQEFLCEREGFSTLFISSVRA
jgi:SAM-dependent methyltransferase